MWDKRCAVVILVKRVTDGCVTGVVVVILVKRVTDGCVTGVVVVILVKRVREGSQYVGQTLW